MPEFLTLFQNAPQIAASFVTGSVMGTTRGNPLYSPPRSMQNGRDPDVIEDEGADEDVAGGSNTEVAANETSDIVMEETNNLSDGNQDEEDEDDGGASLAYAEADAQRQEQEHNDERPAHEEDAEVNPPPAYSREPPEADRVSLNIRLRNNTAQNTIREQSRQRSDRSHSGIQHNPAGPAFTPLEVNYREQIRTLKKENAELYQMKEDLQIQYSTLKRDFSHMYTQDDLNQWITAYNSYKISYEESKANLEKEKRSSAKAKQELKRAMTEANLLRGQHLAGVENRPRDSDETIMPIVETAISSLVDKLARSSKGCHKVKDTELIEGMLRLALVGEGVTAQAIIGNKAQRKLVRSIVWNELVRNIFSKPFFWLPDVKDDGDQGPLSGIGEVYEALRKSSGKSAAAWRSDTIHRLSGCGVNMSEQYKPFCSKFCAELRAKLQELNVGIAAGDILEKIVEKSAELSITLSKDLATYDFATIPVDSEDSGKLPSWVLTRPGFIKWGNSRGDMHDNLAVLLEAELEEL